MMKTDAFFFMILCLLPACKPAECLKSTGNIKKDLREVGFFNKMYVYDNISVELIEGENVYVEAGANLLSLIQTELKSDSTLILSNQAKCNWLRSYETPIKIYVGVKNLGFIRWESYGNLEAKNQIRVNYLQVDVLGVNALVNLEVEAIGISLFANVGTGFSLSGKVSDLGVFVMGHSRVDALLLEAQKVTIKQESSNHIWVNAVQKIEGNIRGLGNIYYKSLPTTDVNIVSKSSGRAITLP